MCSALSVPSFLQSPDPMLSVCGVLHLGGQGSEQGGGGNGATRGHARLSLPTRGSSCLRQLHKACWGFQQILTRKENKLHWLRDLGGGGAPLALLKAPPRPFPTSQILAETFPGSCATSFLEPSVILIFLSAPLPLSCAPPCPSSQHSTSTSPSPDPSTSPRLPPLQH